MHFVLWSWHIIRATNVRKGEGGRTQPYSKLGIRNLNIKFILITKHPSGNYLDIHKVYRLTLAGGHACLGKDRTLLYSWGVELDGQVS